VLKYVGKASAENGFETIARIRYGMSTELSDRVRDIANACGVPESDVFESATEVRIEVHGSIGIIALAYACGRIAKSDASSRLRALQRESTLFMTDTVVKRGIQLL